MYGVYELLKMQGWRWIEPMDVGEVEPPLREKIKEINGLISFD